MYIDDIEGISWYIEMWLDVRSLELLTKAFRCPKLEPAMSTCLPVEMLHCSRGRASAHVRFDNRHSQWKAAL